MGDEEEDAAAARRHHEAQAAAKEGVLEMFRRYSIGARERPPLDDAASPNGVEEPLPAFVVATPVVVGGALLGSSFLFGMSRAVRRGMPMEQITNTALMPRHAGGGWDATSAAGTRLATRALLYATAGVAATAAAAVWGVRAATGVRSVPELKQWARSVMQDEQKEKK